jgi:riboflavin kinase/FMN adenylyltransferase
LVAIGNFDGVHHGHRAVLSDAAAQARQDGLIPLVLTFDPHPAVVLGRAAPPILTTLDRKLELISRVDATLTVIVEPFTERLAAMSPQQFAQDLLVSQLGVRRVIVGRNFRFGRERSGDLGVLVELGKSLGFTASAHTLFTVGDEVVSSSQIRQVVASGDVSHAERLLGRPHAISGRVVPGAGRGRTIGVPTANLEAIAEVLPAHGVYAVLIDEIGEAGAQKLAAGVVNIGVRPTFGGGEPSIEAHLFDLARDLYGAKLRVHLIERIRGERAFASVNELKSQIARDVEQARAITAERSAAVDAGGAWC